MRLLFPLDGTNGLGRQIQQNAVDALHLMGDAVGDVVEDLVGDLLDGCGHGVLGVDGADDGGPALVALLVANAHALDVGHGDEVLPYLLAEAVLVELLAEDGVGLTQGVESVAGDGAQATDTQAGAGEGLTVDHGVGQTQRLAYDAHLVLKEDGQRLHQQELQISGETAHVVVGLDGLLALGLLDALQNVGIDGTLGQELNALQLAGFLGEDVDELLADDLSLALGLGDALEQIQETVGGVYVDQVEIHSREQLDDALGFVLTHETVVDVYAGELTPDGLVQKGGHDGGIHTAGEGQENLLVAYLLADGGYLLVDEGVGLLKGVDALHGFGADDDLLLVSAHRIDTSMKLIRR